MSGEEPFADHDPSTSTGEPQPTDADIVTALADIERVSVAQQEPPLESATPSSNPRNVLIALLALWATAGLVIYAYQHASPRNKTTRSAAAVRPTDPSVQARAEQLLQSALNGDINAADDILTHSNDWVGKTARSSKIDQLITNGLNSSDMHVRAATIQAQLAIDGIPANSFGFELVRGAVGDPQRRAWALWSLGALGSRSVEQTRIAKILGDYLLDPNPSVRAAAVDGMSLLATDEVIPMMLDRFRNDPSPLVQERAACGLSESGMFTRQQRMTAAASIVGWTDDQLLTHQQRGWVFQALHDITGQNFGSDSNAWRDWLGAH